MRFIGGKSLIIPYILEIIEEKTRDVKIISDLFSGSGIVSKNLKKHGYKVISNDLMYFSSVLLRGTVAINEIPKFKGLDGIDPIKYLNELEPNYSDLKNLDLYIYNNYSPYGNRMYFSEKNAIKIDIIRIKIEEWLKDYKISEDEYYYLLASLIEAIPYISNITGVYGAFLKHWDKRALNDLVLEDLEIINNMQKNMVFNMDANKLVSNMTCDLAYYDPPYNQRQYLPNYHILETIAKYDKPNIKGITGLRDYKEEKSKYCSKLTALETFEDLIKSTNARYIILSYNNEGILSNEEISLILKKYAKKESFFRKDITYNRYKNAQTKINKNLKEILYFIEKER